MGNIFYYKGDLPPEIQFKDSIAVDTETMGLDLHRDRLCLVQIGDGKGNAYLVHIQPDTEPKNLKALLTDPAILKIFHFARFDVGKLKADLHIDCAPVYCTKIASKLFRPSQEKHSLKVLCAQHLGITLNKEQQMSDWGVAELSEEQKEYAAGDVLYLHALKEKMDELLKREGRYELALKCFSFLNTRADLDLIGLDDPDIFAHH